MLRNITDEVSDHKKLKIVKRKIAEDLKKRLFFKALFNCGAKVIRTFDPSKAVALVANKRKAKFWGVSHCKSPWCCPVCTAKLMSDYATRISVALDALKARSMRAAMLTFTVPHTSDFSCLETTQILYSVWKAFTVHGNKLARPDMHDVFASFCGSFNSKHRVRVTEYTFGESGWHPHIHALFWFPQDKIQGILDWEERLNERWLELCKRYTLKVLSRRPEYSKKNSTCAGTSQTNSCVESKDDSADAGNFSKLVQRINIMYSKFKQNNSGVFISKDKHGKVILQDSSHYICGWGADRELTGNYNEKATHEGHYTWTQILDKAIATDDAEWWNLYFEYAIATKKERHSRVHFSNKSGINQIIEEYKKTEAYKNCLKKKFTAYTQDVGRWKTVCWFTTRQWSQIYDNDLDVEILAVATEVDALQRIEEILTAHGISPPVQNEAASKLLEARMNAA